MGLLPDMDDLAAMAGRVMNGDLSALVDLVKGAWANGDPVNSPAAKAIAAKVREMLPDNIDDIVQKIDDVLPDSLTSAIGLTPEMMAYLKDILREDAHPAV